MLYSVFDKLAKKLLFFVIILDLDPLLLRNKWGLAFSSEIKYLKEIDGIDLEINKKRIVHYLCQYKNDNSDTFYKNINSAKPSFKYEFLNHKLNYYRYEHHQLYSSKAKNFDEAKEELMKCLQNQFLIIKNMLKARRQSFKRRP